MLKEAVRLGTPNPLVGPRHYCQPLAGLSRRLTTSFGVAVTPPVYFTWLMNGWIGRRPRAPDMRRYIIQVATPGVLGHSP